MLIAVTFDCSIVKERCWQRSIIGTKGHTLWEHREGQIAISTAKVPLWKSPLLKQTTAVISDWLNIMTSLQRCVHNGLCMQECECVCVVLCGKMIFPPSLKNGWSEFLSWLTSFQFWGPRVCQLEMISDGKMIRGAYDVWCRRQFEGRVSRTKCTCLHSDEAKALLASWSYCSRLRNCCTHDALLTRVFFLIQHLCAITVETNMKKTRMTTYGDVHHQNTIEFLKNEHKEDSIFIKWRMREKLIVSFEICCKTRLICSVPSVLTPLPVKIKRWNIKIRCQPCGSAPVRTYREEKFNNKRESSAVLYTHTSSLLISIETTHQRADTPCPHFCNPL